MNYYVVMGNTSTIDTSDRFWIIRKPCCNKPRCGHVKPDKRFYSTITGDFKSYSFYDHIRSLNVALELADILASKEA